MEGEKEEGPEEREGVFAQRSESGSKGKGKKGGVRIVRGWVQGEGEGGDIRRGRSSRDGDSVDGFHPDGSDAAMRSLWLRRDELWALNRGGVR